MTPLHRGVSGAAPTLRAQQNLALLALVVELTAPSVLPLVIWVLFIVPSVQGETDGLTRLAVCAHLRPYRDRQLCFRCRILSHQ